MGIKIFGKKLDYELYGTKRVLEESLGSQVIYTNVILKITINPSTYVSVESPYGDPPIIFVHPNSTMTVNNQTLTITDSVTNYVYRYNAIVENDTQEWDYTWDGWIGYTGIVTSDTILTASASRTKQKYTIKFRGKATGNDLQLEYGSKIQMICNGTALSLVMPDGTTYTGTVTYYDPSDTTNFRNKVRTITLKDSDNTEFYTNGNYPLDPTEYTVTKATTLTTSEADTTRTYSFYLSWPSDKTYFQVSSSKGIRDSSQTNVHSWQPSITADTTYTIAESYISIDNVSKTFATPTGFTLSGTNASLLQASGTFGDIIPPKNPSTQAYDLRIVLNSYTKVNFGNISKQEHTGSGSQSWSWDRAYPSNAKSFWFEGSIGTIGSRKGFFGYTINQYTNISGDISVENDGTLRLTSYETSSGKLGVTVNYNIEASLSMNQYYIINSIAYFY